MFYLKKFKKDNKKISSIFKILIWEICSLLFFRSKISILNYSTKVWLLRKAHPKNNLVIVLTPKTGHRPIGTTLSMLKIYSNSQNMH